MDFKVEDSGEVGVLTINGDMTIQQAGDIRTALMRSLDSVEHVVINLEDVTEVDLSCLQLLCSAHRTSIRLNKSLTLAGKEPDKFKRAVKDAGFSCQMDCVVGINKNCLWMREDVLWAR